MDSRGYLAAFRAGGLEVVHATDTHAVTSILLPPTAGATVHSVKQTSHPSFTGSPTTAASMTITLTLVPEGHFGHSSISTGRLKTITACLLSCRRIAWI
jgi:hypothetical protein